MADDAAWTVHPHVDSPESVVPEVIGEITHECGVQESSNGVEEGGGQRLGGRNVNRSTAGRHATR